MESVLESVERGNEDLTLASLLAYNEEVRMLFMELCMAYVFGLEEKHMNEIEDMSRVYAHLHTSPPHLPT